MKKQKLGMIAGFCVIAAVVGTAVYTDHRTEPDLISGVAHYAYRPVVRRDIDEDIERLAQKVRRETAAAADLAQLAGLYYQQAKLTGRTGDYDQAESTARLSLRAQATHNSGARLIVARVASSRHQFTDAIRIAREALAEDPSKAAPLSVVTGAYLALGNLAEANVSADQFVDRSPGLESYGLRALVYEAEGRDEESTADFVRALQIEDIGETDESAWVRSVFARGLMRRGDYAHARILLDEAIRSVPGYHLALDLRGDLEMREGKWADAERSFRAAFESSKQIPYLVHLARVKRAQGETVSAQEIEGEAEVLLRDELKRSGWGHRIDLAILLLDRGRPADVQEAETLAAADVENRPGALSLGVLARAKLRVGKFAEAQKVLRRALQSGSRDARLYLLMAEIERAVQNPRLVLFYSQLAIALEPKNPAVRNEALSLSRRPG